MEFIYDLGRQASFVVDPDNVISVSSLSPDPQDQLDEEGVSLGALENRGLLLHFGKQLTGLFA